MKKGRRNPDTADIAQIAARITPVRDWVAKKYYTIRLSADDMKRLDTEAERRGMKPRTLARQVLEAWLKAASGVKVRGKRHE